MHNPADSAGPMAATPPPTAALPFRRFRVEVDCDGVPFVWEGEAVSERAAITCAAHDLAYRVPAFEARNLRATSVIEVTA